MEFRGGERCIFRIEKTTQSYQTIFGGGGFKGGENNKRGQTENKLEKRARGEINRGPRKLRYSGL